jgi:hypothetical protein
MKKQKNSKIKSKRVTPMCLVMKMKLQEEGVLYLGLVKLKTLDLKF